MMQRYKKACLFFLIFVGKRRLQNEKNSMLVPLPVDCTYSMHGPGFLLFGISR